MMVDRILSPVQTLGPGRRVVVWVCGCKHICPGCSNPELQTYDVSKKIPVLQAAQMIRAAMENTNADGITITGGEPFDQPGELAALLEMLKDVCEDILVYTGYKLAELEAMRKHEIKTALSCIAALIDGPYIEAQNNGASMRGSNNQILFLFKERFRARYQAEIDKHENKIQNFPISGGVISVGIHKKGFRQALTGSLPGYGLEESI